MKISFIRSLTALAGASLLISACGATPTAAPTSAPAATAAPAATSAPAATTATTAGGAYKIGMILVGPYNDKGWNQATFEGLDYVKSKMPGFSFDYVDKVNSADRPNTKGTQVADDLIAKGANMIIFNSDDFKDDALETAKKHPDIPVIHVSGDYAWKDGKNFKEQKNLINIMGQMEYMKMLAGCSAALGTQTGKIGFVGPLINEETRRLASSAYLGAKYCWTNVLKKDPKALEFKVTWIGFWFNIPGVTLDPTKVADDFYNGGFDVVMSGIDTPEAATEAKKMQDAGKKDYYVHYDYKLGCDIAPDACLGSPYFNWGPAYLDAVKKAQAGTLTESFSWNPPDWKNINDPDTSAVGFLPGKALGDKSAQVDALTKGLADGSINLYKGPLNYQDGSVFLKDGEVATPQQIWYLPQLLEGMEGASSAK
ncbi:MAG: BMP family ABC transporter substrate-binding protein [Chloroflexi bacterium]|nr:BMP family ABC transporter substrate-binding protein [Chloroflexota bacterium]MCL5275465.1 BMP family ABC transporter substrate-binding protein [Chloroflexota bacterium]